MPLPATIERPSREAFRLSLDPVQNAIASMMLVAKNEDMPGVGAWVSQTRAKLSAEELFKHRLVIIGFYFTFQPEREWISFPEYLDALDKSDPVAMREKMLNIYMGICEAYNKELDTKDIDWNHILTSVDNYIDFLEKSFSHSHIEVDVETKAYEYVLDPPAMKKLIVDHLRWFWNEHLSTEWEHVEPILRESAKAFQEANTESMNYLEIARYITGQELDETTWNKRFKGAKQVIFIPNAHIGPYIDKMNQGGTLKIIFGARQPDDSSIRIPELDRADIVARMSALADDTRLRILQIIAEGGELRSQDIIEEIGLSQPSVSRYLTQLTATGYLQERRINGSKAYTLSHARIEKTLKAVHRFLLG